jgi:tetratricopeptide (TPR) repeat protein
MNVFRDGVRLFREGKYSEAVEKLHTVASADQGNHKAWNALGVALSKTGDLEQSIICFENARSLDPDNQTYHKNLERAILKRDSAGFRIPLLPVKQQMDTPGHLPERQVKAIHRQSDSAGWEPLPSVSEPVVYQDYGSGQKIPPESAKHGNHQEKKDKASDFLNQALSLFSQGSYHEMPNLMQDSLDYTERALELDPDYYDAWQLKVSILSTIGRENPQLLKDALQASEHALFIRPEQASMWFNKAGILESLGMYEEAVTAYDQSLSYSSDEPMRTGVILMKKAAALEAIGRENEAFQIYEGIPVHDRFFGEAMEKKAGYLEKKGNRDQVIKSLRTAGMAYLKDSHYEKAITVFTRLLTYITDDEETFYNKGIASFALYEETQSKQYLEDALSSFDSALRIQPGNLTYLIQKGRCLIELGRFEEGLQSLDRALWINPGNGITLMNKGIALYQMSRHEEAFKYFDLVSSQYPEHAAPWIMKARIHQFWKQYDEALTDIDQALEKSPEDSQAWELKVILLRALGREEEAQEAEERLINL